MRLSLAEKFRTEARLGHGIFGRELHRFFKSHDRSSVVQQTLSGTSEVGPRFGEVGLERYRLLQIGGCFLDLRLLAVDLRAKVMWIGCLRLLAQKPDGAIQVWGGK